MNCPFRLRLDPVPMIPLPDRRMMAEALKAARRAALRGEVPVGAILAREGKILSRSGNQTVGRNDPTGHAEVIVLRRAARILGNHRLAGCTLYVTLEPCLMCLGAMSQARIARCVFGAPDPKVGAAALFEKGSAPRGLNHRFPLEGGLMAEESADLLRSFFRQRRREKGSGTTEGRAGKHP